MATHQSLPQGGEGGAAKPWRMRMPLLFWLLIHRYRGPLDVLHRKTQRLLATCSLTREGLNVAALSVQINETYQTCRGRRPDLLRKLTTRENDRILQDNILLYAIQQPYFLIKIVCLSRVAEDVDPYNFKSKTQRQIKIWNQTSSSWCVRTNFICTNIDVSPRGLPR